VEFHTPTIDFKGTDQVEMNAERLLEVVSLLRLEISQTRPYDRLEVLAKALDQGTAAAVQFKEEFVGSLREAPSNHLVPSARTIIKEMQAGSRIGDGLADHLTALFEDYRLGQAEKAAIVRRVANDILRFEGFLNNFHDSAAQLGIRPHALRNGECEIGVLYPRGAVLIDLSNLTEKSSNLDAGLRVFMEVGGELGSPRLSQVASSELQIFVSVSAAIGALFVKAIEKVLAIVKAKLEIDKVRLEIEQLGLDIDAAKQLRERKGTLEEQRKEEAVDEIMATYVSTDDGRRNELRIRCRNALTFMLIEAERGVVFEVAASQNTSEGVPIAEARTSQGTSAIEATNLQLAQRLGIVMNELAAQRDRLLLSAGTNQQQERVNERMS
jgi:hypothetical protein